MVTASYQGLSAQVPVEVIDVAAIEAVGAGLQRLIIGDQDHRCPPEQGLQLYSALKRSGCESELLILPGASHDGSVNGDAMLRRAQNDALLDWMHRFL